MCVFFFSSRRQSFGLDRTFLLHFGGLGHFAPASAPIGSVGRDAFARGEKNGFIKFWGLGRFYTYGLTNAIFRCNDTKRHDERASEWDEGLSAWSLSRRYERLVRNNYRTISNQYLWGRTIISNGVEKEKGGKIGARGKWDVAKLLKSLDN